MQREQNYKMIQQKQQNAVFLKAMREEEYLNNMKSKYDEHLRQTTALIEEAEARKEERINRFKHQEWKRRFQQKEARLTKEQQDKLVR